jgi:hypothetical protein
MEQKPPIHHLIKGIVIAVIWILLNFFVRKSGGVSLPGILQFLPSVIIVAGVAVACILFGSDTRGTLGFGDIFAHGFKTTAVVTFLVAIYTFIMAKFVFPVSAHEIDEAVKSLVDQGNVMTAEARRLAEANAKKAWIIEVSGTIFATLVTGLLGSLLGSALAKKKP